MIANRSYTPTLELLLPTLPFDFLYTQTSVCIIARPELPSNSFTSPFSPFVTLYLIRTEWNYGCSLGSNHFPVLASSTRFFFSGVEGVFVFGWEGVLSKCCLSTWCCKFPALAVTERETRYAVDMPYCGPTDTLKPRLNSIVMMRCRVCNFCSWHRCVWHWWSGCIL